MSSPFSCQHFLQFMVVSFLFLLLLGFSTLTKLSFLWILRLPDHPSPPLPPTAPLLEATLNFNSSSSTPHFHELWLRMILSNAVDPDEFDAGEESLGVLSHVVKDEVNAERNDNLKIQKYLLPAYLLCAIELFNILRCLWNGTYIKLTSTQCWPTVKALLLGSTCALLECACIVFLQHFVVPQLPLYVLFPLFALLLGPALVSLPILQHYVQRESSDKEDLESAASNFTADSDTGSTTSKRRWSHLNVAAANAVLVIVAFVVIGVILAWTDKLHLKMSVATTVVLALLALVWSPPVRFATTFPSKANSMAKWRAGLLYSLIRGIAFPLMLLGVGVATGDIHLGKITVADLGLQLGDHFICFWSNYGLFVASVFISHVLGVLGSRICQQKISTFAIIVSTPLAAIINCFVPPFLSGMEFSVGQCEKVMDHLPLLIAASLVWLLFNAIYFKMAVRNNYLFKPEEEVLLLPVMSAFACEQYLLSNLLCLSDFSPRHFANTENYQANTYVKPRVFICTTMYQESKFEIQRLLQSISKVSSSSYAKSVEIETHIVVDNGIKRRKIGDFSQYLFDLLPATLDIRASEAEVLETPYGLQLRWAAVGAIKLTVHLKDSELVKKKKRWSQIMYMMYVLQFRNNSSECTYTGSSQEPPSFFENIENCGNPTFDDHTYILTTDADMEFEASAVELLVEVMERDRRLGGVCSRTYPMGMRPGPVVWYQMWDYAKEYWLLKSTQQILGAVLCCPGCFSVYRGSALRQVVATYATEVQRPFDTFLKDMGEDRWLCTLMMLKGWKLDYASFCVNSTFCPETFEEFVKQRRRWIMSEIGNMLSVFRHGWRLCRGNDAISFGYIALVFALFCSAVLTPAFTMCLLAGGLQAATKGYVGFAYPLVGLIFVMIVYILVCVYASPQRQIQFSFGLSSLLALVASVMFGGGAIYFIYYVIPSGGFHDSYLFVTFLGVVLLAALLNIKDLPILAHLLWFFLGSLALQLLLPVYVVCNIVDQSWGTREIKEEKSEASGSGKDVEKPSVNADDAGDRESAAVIMDTTPSNLSIRGQHQASLDEQKELAFWQELCVKYINANDPHAMPKPQLARGIRNMRNTILAIFLSINGIWLALFLTINLAFFEPGFTWAVDDVVNSVFMTIYGAILTTLLFGMVTHRIGCIGFRLVKYLFAHQHPFWVTERKFGLEDDVDAR